MNPITDSITESLALKEKGNKLLKNALTTKDSILQKEIFRKALREYHSANLYLRSVDISESEKEGMDDLVTGFMEMRQKKTEEDKKIILELKVQIWNNMSLIYYKMRNFEKTKKMCEMILRIDKINEKALLKLFHCYLFFNDCTMAEEILKKNKFGDKETKDLKFKLERQLDANFKQLMQKKKKNI